MGSQFDTLQIFAMKETNISEKDHKEWAELDFILIHSSRKCEEKTTRFSNVIFHRICPFWNWEVNEVRNNEHRISNLKNKHSFDVLHIHSFKYRPKFLDSMEGSQSIWLPLHCCYGGIENDFYFFGPSWSLCHENLEKLIRTVA